MHESKPEATRFVILAVPRSGSNMLCTMLGSHQAILCHHEIFNPKGIRLALALRETGFTLGTLEERQRSPLEFLERIWAASLGRACVGFKLTHRQNEHVFRALISDPTVSKIVLHRRNRLKTYVSHRISEAIAEWEVYREEDLIRDRPRVRVEPERFLERVAYDEEYYREIRQAALRDPGVYLDVAYESLFAVEEQNRILEFLGQRAVWTGLQIGSVKQNSSNLKDLVENFDELTRFFSGTPFEEELAEGGF
jgi:hypothetical protein